MTDSRRELPIDPWTLSPLGPAFDEALEEGIEELGLGGTLAASPSARRSYEAHARLLRAWNAAINLTSIRDTAAMARRHVVDSLTAVSHLGGLLSQGSSLLDLGSGGGYPGLPLAAALPLARVGLLDSVRKKARFLAVAGAAVAVTVGEEASRPVPLIEAIAERAEDVAEEPEQRAAWDVVTARAVGSLAEVLELGLPLTRERGLVLAWKREQDDGGLAAELREAGAIIRAAGGGRPKVIDVGLAGLSGHRLVLVAKERPTPPAYPRPPGIRRRQRA